MKLIDAEPIEKAIAEWKERETNEPLTMTIVDNVGTMITHSPTVDAIPISWIEEWEEKYTEGEYSFELITDLIEDWRKEND